MFRSLASKRTLIILSSIALALSFLMSFAYFDLYFKADKRFEGEANIVGTVVSSEPESSRSTAIIIKSDNVNGEYLSKYTFIMRMKNSDMPLLEVGDLVSFSADLVGFENNGGFDARSYYYSDGISASCEDVKDFKVIGEGRPSLTYYLARMRELLRRKAIMMTDADTGNLLSALLTGEREELSGQLKQDFTRIGITHILALSGTHLSLLSLAVNKLLSLLKVNKRIRFVFVIIFSVMYMAFVGFSISVVRAGIMLIITSLLFLLFEEADAFNCLCISVFLIILFAPYAIYDLALWLSAFATLGVIVVMQRKRDDNKTSLLTKLLKAFYLAVMSSVYAIAATLLISVISFNGFSLMSVVGTLIFSVLTEVFMYLGCLMLLLGFVWFPLSIPFAYPMKGLFSIIELCATALSTPEFVYINTNHDLLFFATVIFTVVFFTLLIIKLDKRIVNAIVLVCFVTVFTIGILCGIHEDSKESLIYYSQERADIFLMKSSEEQGLVNSSQYSESLSYEILSLLKENNVNSLDKYIVSHYSYALEDDFNLLLSNVPVKEIVLPSPQSDDEEKIYKILSKISEEYRVSITTHEKEVSVSVGDFKYDLLYSHPYGESSSHNSFCLSYRDEAKYLYLSCGMLNDKYNYVYENLINEANVIIFGSHGQKYKENTTTDLVFDKATEIVLSSQGLFLTQNAFLKYKEKGCEIISHPEYVKLIEITR